HRQPAIWTCRDHPKYFVERQVGIDGGQSRARHHELARGPQTEPQCAVKTHLLLRLEKSAVAAFGDEQRDLFRRMDMTMAGGRESEQLEQPHAAAVQERD